MTAAPSIRSRIVLLHLAAFAIMSAAIIAAAFLLLHATVDRFEESVLRSHADTVAQYLSYDRDWKLSLPPELASDYRSGTGSFVLAVITDGRHTLASSFPEPVHLPLALTPGSGGGFSHQQIGSSVFYQLLLPKQIGAHAAWIIVGQNLANPNVIVDDVLAGFAEQLIWIALPILALIFLADILLLRRLFQPVIEASEMATNIQPESAPARLSMFNLPREVLPLAEAFNQALERLEKALRAQREFTADAAHELRTPLTILRSDIDVTLDGQVALRLRNDVDAMAHILNQLLELAELEGESPVAAVPVDLAEVATDVVSLMAPLALKQGRALELSLPHAIPIWVRGNPHMLARAVRNLVENAVRHAPRTGHVLVEARQPGTIVVSDDGPGIPLSDRTLVFKRFWRRDHGLEGHAGLGLAIVVKVAELHRGSVQISDAKTGGAQISIQLPEWPPG